MNVVFITQDFPPDIGGIQTYSLEIARRLHHLCEHFTLVAPDKKEAREIDRHLDFEVLRINSPNTLIGILSTPKVIQLFKKRQIDVVYHVQWQSLFVSAVLQRLGYRPAIVCAAHGREYFFNPFRGILRKGYEKYKHRLLQKVHHFLPVSHYTSGVLGQEFNIPTQQRTVIINGTNPHLFQPQDKQQLKQKHGLEGKMVISSISRLIERKAVDTVLLSLPKVIQRIPNLMYLVVGDGAFRSRLEEMVEELGIAEQVTFVGRIPYAEVSEYYNLSDVYVMPSKFMLPEVEAFGVVYLEANACAVPAIGSRTGGVADAILDGETGLLVEEQNPDELADAIIQLLEDDELRLKLGQQGRKRVEQEANWDVLTQKIFGVLQQVVQEVQSEETP